MTDQSGAFPETLRIALEHIVMIADDPDFLHYSAPARVQQMRGEALRALERPRPALPAAEPIAGTTERPATTERVMHLLKLIEDFSQPLPGQRRVIVPAVEELRELWGKS